VTYDSIGVGASCGNKFKELNDAKENSKKPDVQYTKFIAGGAVVNPTKYYIKADQQKITNEEFFLNLKSQAWWLVADRFRNTYSAINNGGKFDPETGLVHCTNGETFEPDDLISISSEIPNRENLITELSTPKRDFGNNGSVKVESKKDLKAREIDSPNDADSFVMAYAPKKHKRRSAFTL
jgi:phage terminase large subunit